MCRRFTAKMTWAEIVALYRLALDWPPHNLQPRYDVNLELPRNTTRRRLARLIELGLVERVGDHYYWTDRISADTAHDVLLAHLKTLQRAIDTVREPVTPSAAPRSHQTPQQNAARPPVSRVSDDA
jgi:hypothetical protein